MLRACASRPPLIRLGVITSYTPFAYPAYTAASLRKWCPCNRKGERRCNRADTASCAARTSQSRRTCEKRARAGTGQRCVRSCTCTRTPSSGTHTRARSYAQPAERGPSATALRLKMSSVVRSMNEALCMGVGVGVGVCVWVGHASLRDRSPFTSHPPFHWSECASTVCVIYWRFLGSEVTRCGCGAHTLVVIGS